MASVNTSIKCSRCGELFDTELYTSINVAGNPDLKESVKNGQAFLRECPHCGASNLAADTMLYHDPDQKLLICLSKQDIASPEGLEGYTCRLVSEVGDLIEKVKIYDSGLDDVTIEMCKYVTCLEMEKEVSLKFLSMDGADGDLTMAYPENGEMQMIAVGFNVYEDCRGIISRNPILTEKAKGLVRIDQAWISMFMK